VVQSALPAAHAGRRRDGDARYTHSRQVIPRITSNIPRRDRCRPFRETCTGWKMQCRRCRADVVAGSRPPFSKTFIMNLCRKSMDGVPRYRRHRRHRRHRHMPKISVYVATSAPAASPMSRDTGRRCHLSFGRFSRVFITKLGRKDYTNSRHRRRGRGADGAT
jgi:hypothetical protein